jgi:hypothetical protein
MVRKLRHDLLATTCGTAGGNDVSLRTDVHTRVNLRKNR